MEEIYKNLDLNNLEGEEWRDIPNYEGLYQVSNLGRVKSLKFGKEKILKQGKMKNGYLYVVLCKEGKMKTCKVHRLVCQAFLDNPNNFKCVNHKDENKTDNRVDNLEWCDQKYNVNFGTGIKRKVANTNWKAKVKNTDYKAIVAKIDWKAKVSNTDYKAISRKVAEKLSKQVYQYDKNGVLIAIYQSSSEAGRNGFDQGTVSKCCNGKLKHYKGYLWSYTEIN